MVKGAKFLLPAIWKTVILPPLLAYWLLSRLPRPIDSFLIELVVYITVSLSSYIFRSWFSTLRTQVRARQCGARDVPRVKGRWLLNLDVMVDWSRSGREEEVGRMLEVLKREYGTTFNTRVLGEDQVITADPRVIRHVLIDDFDNFVKGEKFYQRAEGFLGDGIFNSDGERWRFHRNLTRPFFHPSHISPSLFAPLIRRFMRALPLGSPFDIHTRISRLALHVSLLWLCGCDLSGEEEAGDQLGHALRTAQEVVGRRVKIGTVWPLFEIGRDPLQEPMRVIRGFFRPLIARAKDKHQRGEGHCLLYQLVDSTDDAKLVEDQLINLLLASRDTTASLLTFLVYAMAIHPTIAVQVREEVRAVAGSDGQVDKDVVRELKFGRAFINETLRLFPPVPLNIRRSVRPSLLPSPLGKQPLYMPGNTSIILATLLAHRDPSIWGADAEEFRPDRWVSMPNEAREAFTSWNIGPRMCLGQPLALALAHTFLVMLCQRLDQIGPESRIALAEESKPISDRMPAAWEGSAGDGRARHGRDKVWICGDVILGIKGGLWVSLDATGQS